MIVRELVTLMGYKVDKKSEKTATSSVEGLKRGAQALAAIFATGIVAQGLLRIIGLGSDAAETMNVITTSFEDQTETVLKWASVQSKELGRSEFALREYAATLGALLRPMTGSATAAAQMSMDLAALTVDLGSFFNAAEPDVLLALRSGITGESEPLKRFGIIMSVAALDAFALQTGIGKTTKEMTEAQKTTLRYNFIMAKTIKAQGDAARTAGGYANLTKALEAVITDLGTELGMMLLPSAEAVLKVLIDTVRLLRGPILAVFRASGTAIRATVRTLDTMLEAITGITGALKIYTAVALIAWVVSTAPILVTIALLGLLAFALVTIIEDLEVMGEGGESVIGGLIGEFQFLLKETDSVFDALTGIITTAIDFWADKLFGFRTDTKAGLQDLLDFASTEFGIVGGQILAAGQVPGEVAARALPTVAGAGGAISVINQIETRVQAATGMSADELAEQTATRVVGGVDRLLRRTAAQLAVGGE